MTDWQPIKTVPDERVLMWMAPRSWLRHGAIILDRPPPPMGYHIVGDTYAFPLEKWAREMQITHWHPLPSPPYANEDQQKPKLSSGRLLGQGQRWKDDS